MEGSGYLGADSKRVSGGNLMGCSEDFLIKGSPKKSGKDVDEKVLSILLKIVDLNPNSDEVLETIRISGFELDGIKDLLTKQHPELCNRNKNNSLIEKNSSKSSNSIVKSSVNNKNNGNNISFNINQNNLNNFNNSINNNNINNISSTDDNNQDNNNNSNDINNSDTLNNNHNNNNTLNNNNNNNNNNSNNNINNNIDNKTNNNISLTNINETNNNSNKIVRGKPPGPPPTKSKLDIPLLGVGGSNDNQNIKGSSSKRAPPKAPPPLKLLNKCKSSILAKDSASESNKDNISKLSELDFGPSPPLGFEPKRLHWSVIPPNKIFGTIWEDIHFSNNNNDDLEKSKETNSDLNKHDEELLFDIKSILDQFFEDKTVLMEKLTLDCSNNISSNSSAKKYRMVLDSKRSQNIEIALKAMQLFDNNNELDISPIVEMLGYEKKTLQDGIDVFLKGVSKERLKILLDLYPTPEEIQLLNSINDRNIENLPLRSSEFFLVSILNLNRFKVRAQCVLSMKTFEEEYLSCLERLIKLEDAVVHIRSSLEKGGVLRLILHLILRIGNYLNHGTNRGKSFGFRFHSIELLKNVKTNNSKSNLLKYISKIVYDHSELMRQKIDIVSQACSEAAPIDITDVYKDIEELEKNIDFIKQELKLFSVKNDQLKVTKSSTTNNELSETNIGNSKSIKFENELQIPVFEVESSKEKTTDELYLNMVEKFVNDSSKQLEIAKKQLTEIINKLNELQFYAGETQSNNLNKVNNNSNIEIIKRCDMFFRLIKYEFNEFQIIEKKKNDREVRKLMGIKPSKSSENIKERMSDKNSFNNGNVKSNLRKSDLISEFSSTHEIENNIPSNQISDSSHQLLLEISNITLTSNSSTLSSTDSSCFQDQNKNKSDQEIQIEDLEHTPINKKNFNLSNSNSVSLHSGYDPITSSIHRCKKEFNNKCCQSNIYENGFSDLCNSKSNFHLQQNINSDINYKDVYQHQPICLKSFFDASSTTANIAARVYNSQIQDSNRSRKSHNQYSN